MIRRVLVLLAIAAAPAALAESDVAKGLQNLTMLHRVAQLAQMGASAGIVPPELPLDPWGTAYEVRLSDGGYVAVSAGSDRRFDETTWQTSEQFAGLEGDVVIANAKVIRSNRRWLHAQVSDSASRAALDALRKTELELMMMQHPAVFGLLLRAATESMMQSIAAHIASGGELPPTARDLWGTHLRLVRDSGTVRLISAGADRTFDPMSWSRPPASSVDEDIVVENGQFTRPVDRETLLRAARPAAKPLEQPPDARVPGEFPRVGGEIKAPVVKKRVEPKFDEDYRRSRVTGIVILEMLVTETGAVEHVGVIKSLAPEHDLAAVEAVKQWTFDPATIGGKPTPVLFNVTINFKLK